MVFLAYILLLYDKRKGQYDNVHCHDGRGRFKFQATGRWLQGNSGITALWTDDEP